MKILLLHNRYQIPGGEDVVAQSEKNLLEAKGHDVAWLEVNNDGIGGIVSQLKTAANTIYSYKSKQQVRQTINSFHPDIVHVHNFFPLLSPAVYDACQEAGIPVIQTLHNYRLLCPNAEFFRDGGVCEDCLGKFFPLPGVIHACYRESRAATAAVATMLAVHRARGTWRDRVNLYITLTEFARQKFIESGLPAHKIVVKPNFLFPDPGLESGIGAGYLGEASLAKPKILSPNPETSDVATTSLTSFLGNGENPQSTILKSASESYALFVGRLSPEKGIDTLLAAWKNLDGKFPLKIVGDGPLAGKVAEVIQELPGVAWLGRLPQNQVLALMKEALVLVCPSLWYEGLPMTIVEAYAVGLPVIASKLGSLSASIDPGITGFHFPPGDVQGLTDQVKWVLAHRDQLTQMRQSTRAEFEAKYTAEASYRQLMDIYAQASPQKGKRFV